jgi:hypothetical protein
MVLGIGVAKVYIVRDVPYLWLGQVCALLGSYNGWYFFVAKCDAGLSEIVDLSFFICTCVCQVMLASPISDGNAR